MESKICSICSFEEDINNFYKKYSEWNNCNSLRSLKRFCENKDKISNQGKVYYGKNKKRLSEKQIDRYKLFN